MPYIDKITVDSTTYNIQDSAAQAALEILNPSAAAGDVGKFLKVKTVSSGSVTEYEFGAGGSGGSEIDDTAGDGDTDKTWSANKLYNTFALKYEKPSGGIPSTDLASGVIPTVHNVPSGGSANQVLAKNSATDYDLKWVTPSSSGSANYVTPEDYGAVGDGTTDDSEAVQDAVDAGYAVYFDSNKTYYLASAVTINHDCYLFGGKNATIKTATPSGGTVNDGIVVSGTLKSTTTLTSNYYTVGSASDNNRNNQLTLSDMSDVEVGDILVIKAKDQYYSYSRQYFYLGGTFKVVDKYNGHIYINRNMPFDIELTNSVTVYVYSAPVVKVDNLHFVSDLDSMSASGLYPALLRLYYCKDSVITNCSFSHFKVGIYLNYCVNVLADGIHLEKSRFDNSDNYSDGYGILLQSGTNTVFRRVVSMCAQGCIDMGGDIPIFDTYIKESEIASECRVVGLDMHDNSYNLVVEDCVLCGASIYGTAIINRCHFIRNGRVITSGNFDDVGISFKGSHDQRWARLHVSNCVFDDNLSNYLTAQTAQTPIQSINSVIDKVVFEHCIGGKLHFAPSTNSYILSNTLNDLIINDWRDCYEIYHAANQTIKRLSVTDSVFTKGNWLNNHTVDFSSAGIETAIIKSTNPYHYWLLVNSDINGTQQVMTEGNSIALSATSQSALYVVSGINSASNDPDVYEGGTISGSAGDAITKTPKSGFSGTLTTNSDGNLVFAHPANTDNYSIYPKYMMCADEDSVFRISCTLKNTGETVTGQGFRAYIVVINPATGKITYKGNGTSATATSGGAGISHYHDVPKGYVVFGYLGAYDSVSGSETTFENFQMTLVPAAEPEPAYSKYIGSKRTGDGTLQSVAGVNNIMSSEDTFHASCFAVMEHGMYASNIPSAAGVSF